MRQLVAFATMIAALVALSCQVPARAAPGDIQEFLLPDQTGVNGPDMPMVGPDGNIWFVEFLSNKIAFIEPNPPHLIKEFQLPATTARVRKMTIGPDGNIWFAFEGTTIYLLGGIPGNIGRIIPRPPYTVTIYPPPFQTYFSDQIATGADGNIWYTAQPGVGAPPGSTEKVLSISPADPTRFDIHEVPPNTTIRWLLPGHRNDFFFFGLAGQDMHNVVGRFSIRNTRNAQMLRLPGGGGPSYVQPTDLIWGPDETLWLPNWSSINDFSLTTRFIDQVGVYPQAIGLAFAADGNLWFTTGNFGTATISRMTPSYPFVITDYTIPLPNGISVNNVAPTHLVNGPDGNLWGTLVANPGGAILKISVR